jgi:peptidoglycan-associated lipoprotein
MKLTKFTQWLLVAGIALSFAAVSCKSRKPVNVTPIPGRTGGGPGDVGPGGAIEGGPGGGGEATAHAAANPADWATAARDDQKFAADVVHFDYDSSVVKSSEKSKLQNVADYLRANAASTGVEIEGHCDERGTDQYNYALGERRALALREELISMGIDPNRILTKSYGRSRLIDLGTTEEAHARNRRGVFILLTK